MTDIQKAFDETLQGSQLPDAGVDIVEASIDSLIDNDVLKEIPIVKTFVGLAQVGANINDKLDAIIPYDRFHSTKEGVDNSCATNHGDRSGQIKAADFLQYNSRQE